MIVASRLCRPDHSAFDGTGGLLRAGRWHERGSRVVYAADSEALAALEVLVRLTSVGQFPSYVCIKASIPESLVADIRDFAALPIDWSRRDPSGKRRRSELVGRAMEAPQSCGAVGDCTAGIELHAQSVPQPFQRSGRGRSACV